MKIHETRKLYLHVFREESEGVGTCEFFLARCDGCKHWASEAFVSSDRDARECTKLDYNASAVAVSGDFAASNAALVTQPYFGCSAFEPKDPTT